MVSVSRDRSGERGTLSSTSRDRGADRGQMSGRQSDHADVVDELTWSADSSAPCTPRPMSPVQTPRGGRESQFRGLGSSCPGGGRGGVGLAPQPRSRAVSELDKSSSNSSLQSDQSPSMSLTPAHPMSVAAITATASKLLAQGSERSTVDPDTLSSLIIALGKTEREPSINSQYSQSNASQTSQSYLHTPDTPDGPARSSRRDSATSVSSVRRDSLGDLEASSVSSRRLVGGPSGRLTTHRDEGEVEGGGESGSGGMNSNLNSSGGGGGGGDSGKNKPSPLFRLSVLRKKDSTQTMSLAKEGAKRYDSDSDDSVGTGFGPGTVVGSGSGVGPGLGSGSGSGSAMGMGMGPGSGGAVGVRPGTGAGSGSRLASSSIDTSTSRGSTKHNPTSSKFVSIRSTDADDPTLTDHYALGGGYGATSTPRNATPRNGSISTPRSTISLTNPSTGGASTISRVNSNTGAASPSPLSKSNRRRSGGNPLAMSAANSLATSRSSTPVNPSPSPVGDRGEKGESAHVGPRSRSGSMVDDVMDEEDYEVTNSGWGGGKKVYGSGYTLMPRDRS